MSLPDIKGLLDTARRIQDEVARVRETLGGKTVTGETGGGLVRCVANGKGEVVSITVDPSIVGDRAWSRTSRWAPSTWRSSARASWPRPSSARRRAACRCRRGCSGADVFASPIARLVQQLAKLPGIGEKTAARLAFHILRAAPEDAAALAAAITTSSRRSASAASAATSPRPIPCAVCADARRETGLVCVVAQPQDVVAIERTGGYRGRYHVLHGLLSPLDGIGPEDLRVAELLRRCADARRPRRRRRSSSRPAPPSRARRRPSTCRSSCVRSACARAASPRACPSAASSSTPTS